MAKSSLQYCVANTFGIGVGGGYVGFHSFVNNLRGAGGVNIRVVKVDVVHPPLADLPIPVQPLTLRLVHHLLAGLGSQALRFGFQVSGFGFRISSLVSQIWGFRFQISSLGSRVSGDTPGRQSRSPSCP
jgi:hypothetical protein